MGLFSLGKGAKLGAKVGVKVINEITERTKTEKEKQACAEGSKKLVDYTLKNLERITKIAFSLRDETQKLINQVNSVNGKLSFRQKMNIQKIKEEAEDNLDYLYLIKDYFLLLTKVANGLILEADNYVYIVKFAPFFDGIKVLDFDGEDENEDYSLFGEFKEMGNDLKEMFIGGKEKEEKVFTFYEYLTNYSEEIDTLVMPDIDAAINSFKSIIDNEIKRPAEVKPSVASNVEEVECPNCKFKVSANAKFCPECGTKIEIQKNKFCPDCGATLTPNAKFCPECGHKVN